VRDLKVDASSMHLETPLILYYYPLLSSRAAMILYYYILAAAILWGRLATCAGVATRPFPQGATTPDEGYRSLRLAAMRIRLFNLRPIVNRPDLSRFRRRSAR
jgi:hypothetical protein